ADHRAAQHAGSFFFQELSQFLQLAALGQGDGAVFQGPRHGTSSPQRALPLICSSGVAAVPLVDGSPVATGLAGSRSLGLANQYAMPTNTAPPMMFPSVARLRL